MKKNTATGLPKIVTIMIKTAINDMLMCPKNDKVITSKKITTFSF